VRGPLGYRSPAWDFSKNTVKLLLEMGFLYDSRCMGGDFNPYYLRTGASGQTAIRDYAAGWQANNPMEAWKQTHKFRLVLV
jgi:predicted deacetylase